MEETFRTVINIPPSPNRINHKTPVLLIGSCFTEHIGNKLVRYQFPACINPAGIQYNPASVAATLNRIAEERYFTEEDLEQDDEGWFSWAHHGSFSSSDKAECLRRINSRLSEADAFLKHADYICITFGTAYYYTLKDSGKVVSNCHKQPADRFKRERLTSDAVVRLFRESDRLLRFVNNTFRYIFTVSPVRHLKDGLSGNQLSKSVLRVAVDELCSFLPAEYFPAYEIMTDDLRDYRFYADDMVHPDETAVRYIWDHFQDTFMDDTTRSLCREMDPLLKAFNHRPVDPDSKAHRRFMESLREKTEAFEKKYPFLSFSKEDENS